MAVHFDPLNRAAIDLRSDIWLGRKQGEHTLTPPTAALPPAQARRRPNTVQWLLDDLEHAPARLPAPDASARSRSAGPPPRHPSSHEAAMTTRPLMRLATDGRLAWSQARRTPSA